MQVKSVGKSAQTLLGSQGILTCRPSSTKEARGAACIGGMVSLVSVFEGRIGLNWALWGPTYGCLSLWGIRDGCGGGSLAGLARVGDVNFKVPPELTLGFRCRDG